MRDKVKKHKTLLCGLAIFAVFLTYYNATSRYLPLGAGPDEPIHNDATTFIYEHYRLPTIPRDEDKMMYSAYGGTRALRPPLPYVVAAATARLLPWAEQDRPHAFRKGAVVLGALTVAIVFYAGLVYFGSYWLALLGATLIGLMPQFAFVASYTNDDIGGIFAATFLFTVLLLIYRRGLSWVNAALLGGAGGLVILAKPSAWIILPAVALLMTVVIRAPWRELWRKGALAAVCAVLAGGWWLGFNVYHYGIGDPLQSKIIREVAERHSRFPTDVQLGFAAHNIGYYDLVVKNHRKFWQATGISTVGNLDWLRLRVGWLEYTLYGMVLALALGYVLVRLARAPCALARNRAGPGADGRRLGIEALFLFAVVFQVYMYLWANIYNDIQLQGKYLLPVFLPVLILFLSALQSVTAWVKARLAANGVEHIVLPVRAIGKAAGAGLIMLVIAAHADALVNYVIPFYQPPAHKLKLTPLRVLTLPRAAVKELHDIKTFELRDAGILIEADGDDPWFVLDIGSTELCNAFIGNSLLRVRYASADDSLIQIFVDEGRGFGDHNAYAQAYKTGENEMIFALRVAECRRIRIDPRVHAGRFTIKELAVARITIGK